MLFSHTGILNYSRPADAYRLTVEVDDQLGDYYRSLIPAYYNLAPGRYATHVTVVRIHKEVPTNLSVWGKYQGDRVEFLYEPEIHHGTTYFWLRVVSKRLEEIRTELGLSAARSTNPAHASYAIPPQGYSRYFHSTIGNIKHLAEEDDL